MNILINHDFSTAPSTNMTSEAYYYSQHALIAYDAADSTGGSAND